VIAPSTRSVNLIPIDLAPSSSFASANTTKNDVGWIKENRNDQCRLMFWQVRRSRTMGVQGAEGFWCEPCGWGSISGNCHGWRVAQPDSPSSNS
jgi:hypothetical protein